MYRKVERMLNPVIQEDVERICKGNADLAAFDNQTLMITGATGFVGSFLVHTLLQSSLKRNGKTKIVAIVRNEQRAREMFAPYVEKGMMEFLVQDVCQPVGYEGPVDYVIHCASNAAPKEYGTDPVGTMKTNFLGTNHLLELGREKKIKKFLYVSTIEVYGTTYNVPRIGEHDFGIIDSTKVRSCYPISKKACETLCISYSEQYQVPVVIGRLSYIYGPGMKPNDSKVVAQFTRDVAAGRDIVMKSKGEQLRSYTYIADAASGLLTVLAKGADQEAYNVASPDSITTICGMAQTLVELFPEKGAKVLFDLPTETEAKRFSLIQDAVLNPEKLETLGWKAEISLKEGLARVVESLSEK